MDTDNKVPPTLELEHLQDLRLLNPRAIVGKHFKNRTASLDHPFRRQSLTQQIVPRVVTVGQVDVADMVNDPPIELFRNSLIETAVPCLHVEYRNLQTFRDNRSQATVRSPQEQQRIRSFQNHNFVGPSKNIAQRLTQASAY